MLAPGKNPIAFSLRKDFKDKLKIKKSTGVMEDSQNLLITELTQENKLTAIRNMGRLCHSSNRRHFLF
jgi:hypothetical protein